MDMEHFNKLCERRADMTRRKRQIKGDIERANKAGNLALLGGFRSERPLLDAMLEINYQELWVEMNAIERARKKEAGNRPASQEQGELTESTA